jgi:hypothetical protein
MHAVRASLRLGAARSLRAAVARRPAPCRVAQPARTRASSSPQRAGGAAAPPAATAAALGGAAAAGSGSPRSVAAAAAATADAPQSMANNPLLSTDLFPRFNEARGAAAALPQRRRGCGRGAAV